MHAKIQTFIEKYSLFHLEKKNIYFESNMFFFLPQRDVDMRVCECDGDDDDVQVLCVDPGGSPQGQRVAYSWLNGSHEV